MAPIKVAVLPLSKKLAEPAQRIAGELRQSWNTFYDEAGNIGRRYRRQDEAGTPYCVTFDFESETDQQVTVRERDSMAQDPRAARRAHGLSARASRTLSARRAKPKPRRAVYFFGAGGPTAARR